ncbi:hypothetical protein [Streptomyces bikiniensis]|uniref:hypothetical protein n=1 Tax=Streptomyces bikiniensis TaxID=1896 RepID=UPI0004C0A583|nr:hypothetical protein [Streptomyces bikiniensis]
MTLEVSRRAALLTAVGGALALSALSSGAAQAAPAPTATRGRPFVTNPRETGALYDAGTARTTHAEPLNAAVGCATGRGGRS